MRRLTFPENYKLAFEEARRGLENQQGRVDELRSRAGTLLAAIAVATSFLGSEALSAQDSGCLVWAGFVFFALSMVCAIWILLPQDDWRFEANVKTIIEDWVEREPPFTESELHRKLGLEMEGYFLANGVKLRTLYWVFTAASGFLLLELTTFALAIATSR